MATLDNMCRSFLTPYVDENNKPKYWGRFNQGVVTINLVDVALSSGGDFDKFWHFLKNGQNYATKHYSVGMNELH